ncbi:hypothetical protein I0Q12_19570 [Rhodococcus sp. CX]|uniref:hypothetical protein n=1 Tax=Rhodococcus sp. CX TaxID=2789880 RepID=UPI0018CC9E50|nr:hypothetical protein [Rhodococcus sp. CX]MBH0121591.1 hypothetical protein [Rhodococcus sp. CX]
MSEAPPNLPEAIAPTVARLARAGMSRNAISRALRVAHGTVTTAANLAGVEFDRSITAAATKARAEDLKARRQKLSEQFLALAENINAATDPTAEDARDLRERLIAAGIATDKHLRLDEHDTSGAYMSAVDHFMAAMLGDQTAEDEEIDQAAIYAELNAARPATADPVDPHPLEEPQP